MGKNNFFKSNFAFVVYTLIAAVVVGLLILAGVFFWLNHYTQHGVETAVPNICGMYVEEAQLTLSHDGLQMEIIDSTYSKKVPLGTIVEQNPPANAKVKQGRAIYVIMNARSHRQVPMPELHDVSFRQAEATLNALGLHVADIQYEPSEYRDLVLDVRANGESVEAGTRLSEGTCVTLVVGQGKGNVEVMVPQLQGQTLVSARAALLAARLIVGAVNYDEVEPALEDVVLPAESEQVYYVYDQKPRGGEWVMEGSHIDLYLSTDPQKKPTATDVDEEEFF